MRVDGRPQVVLEMVNVQFLTVLCVVKLTGTVQKAATS